MRLFSWSERMSTREPPAPVATWISPSRGNKDQSLWHSCLANCMSSVIRQLMWQWKFPSPALCHASIFLLPHGRAWRLTTVSTAYKNQCEKSVIDHHFWRKRRRGIRSCGKQNPLTPCRERHSIKDIGQWLGGYKSPWQLNNGVVEFFAGGFWNITLTLWWFICGGCILQCPYMVQLY